MTAKERLKQQVNKDRIERGSGEYALSAKDRLRQTVVIAIFQSDKIVRPDLGGFFDIIR